MQPVIFLDFDGVLNHDDNDSHELGFEPDNVKRLNTLLRSVPAEIVIISAWRKEMSVDQLKRFFKKHGLPQDRVVSKTSDPSERGGRGREIELWLNAHPEVTSYVVIDDNDIDLEKFRDVLVQPISSKGLTNKDVEKAVNILAGSNA